MRWNAGWVMVLSCAVGMWAQEKGNPQMTVVVYDEVGASVPFVGNAEDEAGRVLDRAGIEIRWVDCLPAGSGKTMGRCFDTADSTSVSLRVVRRPRSLSERAMGVAFVTKGEGRYADIFFDHVDWLSQKSTGVNLDTILGYVMAHEIGHLLLGSNSHSQSGIMQGEWHSEQLRSIAMGKLLFTSEQAERMRERVAVRAEESRAEPSLAGLRREK